MNLLTICFIDKNDRSNFLKKISDQFLLATYHKHVWDDDLVPEKGSLKPYRDLNSINLLICHSVMLFHLHGS